MAARKNKRDLAGFRAAAFGHFARSRALARRRQARRAGFWSAAWNHFDRRAAVKRALARRHLKRVLEALLFAAPDPLPLRTLARAARSRQDAVLELLDELEHEYHDRGIQVVALAGGYAFRTHPDHGSLVRELVAPKPTRLTRAQLETLAIVSYRQPVTRPEIDDIRGVDSGPVLRTLLERELIRILGKKEEPGRPLLYGTTDDFLTLFGLPGLASLPTLREFTELSDDSQAKYEQHHDEPPPDDDPAEPTDELPPDPSDEAQPQADEAAAPQPDSEPTEANEAAAPQPDGTPTETDEAAAPQPDVEPTETETDE